MPGVWANCGSALEIRQTFPATGLDRGRLRDSGGNYGLDKHSTLSCLAAFYVLLRGLFSGSNLSSCLSLLVALGNHATTAEKLSLLVHGSACNAMAARLAPRVRQCVQTVDLASVQANSLQFIVARHPCFCVVASSRRRQEALCFCTRTAQAARAASLPTSLRPNIPKTRNSY
eukprot:scaffold1402_cov254-Pinguiococcus_pyrenoidosus.AAC.16